MWKAFKIFWRGASALSTLQTITGLLPAGVLAVIAGGLAWVEHLPPVVIGVLVLAVGVLAYISYVALLLQRRQERPRTVYDHESASQQIGVNDLIEAEVRSAAPIPVYIETRMATMPTRIPPGGDLKYFRVCYSHMIHLALTSGGFFYSENERTVDWGSEEPPLVQQIKVRNEGKENLAKVRITLAAKLSENEKTDVGYRSGKTIYEGDVQMLLDRIPSEAETIAYVGNESPCHVWLVIKEVEVKPMGQDFRPARVEFGDLGHSMNLPPAKRFQ